MRRSVLLALGFSLAAAPASAQLLAPPPAGAPAARPPAAQAPVPTRPPTASAVIDAAAAVDAVEAQMGGDYGAMQRDLTIPLGMIQRAWDDAPEGAGTYRVTYDPNKVIRLRTRQFMTTTVLLPEWETVTYFDLGDGFAFEGDNPRPNVLRLRALRPGADTNVTVIGSSGNAYVLYLRGEGHNSEHVPDLLVQILAAEPRAGGFGASWGGDAWGSQASGPATGEPTQLAGTYAATAAAGNGWVDPMGNEPGAGLEDPDFLREIPYDPGRLRFDYSMTGERSIAPYRVFDDGVFTYFDYGDRWDATDLPAVYRVVDGVDTPQNQRIVGSMIVVEATGAFTLRNGQRVVCVRPAGWQPGVSPAQQAAPSPSLYETAAEGGR